MIALAPSMVASALLIGFAKIERYKRTPLGHYVATCMMEAMRLLGQLLMWLGAAAHVPWLIPFGFVVIVFAWLNRLLIPTPGEH